MENDILKKNVNSFVIRSGKRIVLGIGDLIISGRDLKKVVLVDIVKFKKIIIFLVRSLSKRIRGGVNLFEFEMDFFRVIRIKLFLLELIFSLFILLEFFRRSKRLNIINN